MDAARVTLACVTRGSRALEVGAHAEVPLAAGALVPSPVEENLLRPDDVRAALEAARTAAGRNGSRVSLVLADGLARPLLVEAPRGVEPREFARFRLGPGLPYPPAEAIVDGLAVGGGRFLAAAIRQKVVRSYELVAESVGLTVERVAVAGLGAVAGFLSAAERGNLAVAVLGDAAVSVGVFRSGALAAYRSRLRLHDAGETARLRDEILRTARLAGAEELARVSVVGPGARALGSALTRLGLVSEPGWGPGADPEAAESVWPGAASA